MTERTHRAAAATSAAGHRAAIVFVVTALGSFMAALDLSIVNVAFPDMRTSFAHTSQAALAWVITAYSIVFGSLLVTGGRTGDRVGRRRTFLVGTVVFLAGSFLCGVAPNVGLLVASRVVQGIGAAFLVPASVALLIDAYPAERRTQMVALWGGIGALAVATGPSLGAAIVSAGGWRWAFFVNLPVGIVVLVVGRRVLVETEVDAHAAHPDYLGVGMISLALAGVVLAISEGEAWGWTDPKLAAVVVASCALGTLFVRRSRVHPEPVIDLTLFTDRSLVAANAATFVYAMGFFSLLLGNILFLTGVWHYTIMRAGLAVTPGPVVVACIAGPVGKLAARRGFRQVLGVGAVVFATGLAWFVAFVGAEPAYLTQWLPGTLLVGVGIGFTFPVLSAAAVASLPPQRFAVGSAINQTARQIGGAIGVAVLVVIIGTPVGTAQTVDRFHHLWAFGALAALGSGLLAAGIPRRRAAAPSPAQVAAVAGSSSTTLPVT